MPKLGANAIEGIGCGCPNSLNSINMNRTIMKKKLGILLLLCAGSSAIADTPFGLEEVLTAEGKVKIETSIAYTNSSKQVTTPVEAIIAQQIGPTSFVLLPTKLGTQEQNSDIVLGTIGLRYGVSSKSEVYSRVSYLYSSTRGMDASGSSLSVSSDQFSDAWVGVNYQFKKDDQYPALVGFFETALAERLISDVNSFKSFLVGATAYKTIDPMVLSITSAYRHNVSREDSGHSYKPGSIFMVNPLAVLSVNEKIGISLGFQWSVRQKSEVDGQSVGYVRTNTDLIAGVTYGIAKGNTIGLSLRTNSSGSNGADLRANWLIAF